MYIDVHCHLNGEDYGDLEGLVAACEKRGINRLITVGFDLPSSQYCRQLSEKFPQVYFAAGFHPTELKKYKEGDLEEIERLCGDEKCVAWGEIGLDYHYPDTDKILQREMFVKQLVLADKLKLPVEIHSRDCAEDMLQLLQENRRYLNSGALMHCYSHSPEMAGEFVKLGVSFSFGGTSTYKRSKKARRTIEALPENLLLTETDSPYLPPASAFGTFPNTPLSIPEITANMAQIRGVDEKVMANVVMNNARALFKKLK